MVKSHPVQHAQMQKQKTGESDLELPDCKKYDEINHPEHYMSHPSGVECITITEYMSFNIGNAIKYLWRAGLKPLNNTNTEQHNSINATIIDYRKAIWYIQREIKRIENQNKDLSNLK